MLVKKNKAGSCEVLYWMLGLLLLSACAGPRRKPCTEGGQPPHENAAIFQGKKKCFQVKDSNGAYVNDGKYFEWYPNEKLATRGEYHLGKKMGRWLEYDVKGKLTSDKYFDEGKEVARP